MSDETAARDLWFQYLNKVNDRALSRSTASGFTTWAVAAMIAVLGFRVIDRIPALAAAPDTIPLHVLSLAGTANLAIFLIFAVIVLIVKSAPVSESRIERRVGGVLSPVVVLPIAAALVSMITLNILAVPAAGARGLMRWPFVAVAALYAPNVLVPVASKARTALKKMRRRAELPAIDVPVYVPSPALRRVSETCLVLLVAAGLVFSTLPAAQALPQLRTQAQIDTLKWSLEVTGVGALAILLFFRLAGSLGRNHMERLEQRVVLEGLSAEAIGDLFVREFLGPTVREWLAQGERELLHLHSDFETAAGAAEEQFAKLATLDRGMTYEIAGRKKEICQSVRTALDTYMRYSEALVEKLRHLANRMAFTSAPELVEHLAGSLRLQLKVTRSRYDQVCEKCRDAASTASAGAESEILQATEPPECQHREQSTSSAE